MSVLEDLASAQKYLCQLASGQGVGSGSPVADLSRQHSSPSIPQQASSPYLNDHEEAELARQMGMDASPFMDNLMTQHFRTIEREREELKKNPDLPQPIMPQSRPKMIIPGFEPKMAKPELDYAPDDAQPPAPEEASQEVPPEIAFMDQLTKRKAGLPDIPVGQPMHPKAVLSDFETFMQQNG